MCMFRRIFLLLTSVTIALYAISIPLFTPIGTTPLAIAQTGCSYLHTHGGVDSGTGASNTGTQGLVYVPSTWSLPNDSSQPFITNAVWVWSLSNIYYSTEGGISYGLANQTGTFQAYWYYYHTIQNGANEWDDTESLTPGAGYYVSVWFQTAGPTYVNFYGTPNGGGYPTWSHQTTQSTWVGNDWHNWAQGETTSSCGTWSQAYWYNMAWTENGSTWYYWGQMTANPQGVNVGYTPYTTWDNYR